MKKLIFSLVAPFIFIAIVSISELLRTLSRVVAIRTSQVKQSINYAIYIYFWFILCDEYFMLSLKACYKFASLLVCNHAKSSLCYSHADGKHEYCNDFDLRKPLERHFLSSQHIDCVSIQETQDLAALRNRCATFLTQFPRYFHIL